MSDQQAQVHTWMVKTRRVLRLNKLPALPRKILVGGAGGIILVAGVIMLATPGPAVVLIPVGLLLLGSEFKFMEDAAQGVLDLLTRARKACRRWWSKGTSRD